MDIPLRTPSCIICGQSTVIEITEREYHEYFVMDHLAQVAFPDRDDDFRELLITGTHNACWMTMYSYDPSSQEDFKILLNNVMQLFACIVVGKVSA